MKKKNEDEGDEDDGDEEKKNIVKNVNRNQKRKENTNRVRREVEIVHIIVDCGDCYDEMRKEKINPIFEIMNENIL